MKMGLEKNFTFKFMLNGKTEKTKEGADTETEQRQTSENV